MVLLRPTYRSERPLSCHPTAALGPVCYFKLFILHIGGIPYKLKIEHTLHFPHDVKWEGSEQCKLSQVTNYYY